MVLKSTNPTVCTLEFEKVDNLNLNGSEPVVKEGLVPVVIANDGTVIKTETDDINWYDYNESKWANTVILTGTDTYGVGDTIPEEAIESYFVWIPKYRYKLFNVEGNSISPQEIEIEIGDYNTVNSDTECIAPNISGDIGNCKNLNDEKGNGKWMTHPAFTSLGVNGLWIGKFETGYKGSTDKSSAEKNENAPEKVQIKPNVNSWRSISISNIYYTSFNYKRDLDSHMMKNTEWGAMAYFTNSKYGRGNTEVAANLDNNFITGCTNKTTYFNGGIEASTTGNYSGIYDACGGASEYVIGNLNDLISKSGFTEDEIKNINYKYIDRYTATDVNAKVLGDATGETKGWKYNYTDIISSDYPWMRRGASFLDGQNAYMFDVSTHWGGASPAYGFRLVLSPSN